MDEWDFRYSQSGGMSDTALGDSLKDFTFRQRALLDLAARLRAEQYRFITVTPASHERVNARPENRWARSLEDVFGWNRGFQPALLPAGLFDDLVSAEVVARDGQGWRSTVRVSSLNDQLLLHSAHPTESGDAVFFGPDSYRFVNAIAALLERRPAPRRVADIGCGAGAGMLQVAAACPDAEVHGVDVNARALEYTRLNAALNGVDNVQLHQGSLFEPLQGHFDLIIANPPYLLDPGRRLYRDGGGELGEALSVRIALAALERLAPGGVLLLYTGVAMVEGRDPFLEQVAPVLERPGLRWHYREMDPDVFGEELADGVYRQADRIAAVVLTVESTA